MTTTNRSSKNGQIKKTRTGPTCAAIALMLVGAAALAAPLAVQNGRFVDPQGGDIVLRGFNLSGAHKVPPFLVNQDPQLFGKLTKLGVNVVRLQFNWEAFEPQPGVYDENYLDNYANVVARAAASQVYVLVDIHQDGFSRWALDGCGEGFPQWAMAPGVRQSPPDNGTACESWPVKVLLQKAEQATLVDHLITPGTLAYERYMALLGRLSERFAKTSNVVGYDLYNEPATILDTVRLLQFYQAGAKRVRTFHQDAIVFIEPEARAGLCLTPTPLASIESTGISNAVYAPHYYDILTTTTGLLPLISYKSCAQTQRALATKWGAGYFLGEFGVKPKGSFVPFYIDSIYTEMERAGSSGTQWNYTGEWTSTTLDGWNGENLSVVDDKGQLRANFRPRPYVQRTAGKYGEWFSQGFALTGQCLARRYRWDHEPAKGSTEIFFPVSCLAGRNAPVIETLSAHGTAACRWIADKQLVRCSGSHAEPVTVKLN